MREKRCLFASKSDGCPRAGAQRTVKSAASVDGGSMMKRSEARLHAYGGIAPLMLLPPSYAYLRCAQSVSRRCDRWQKAAVFVAYEKFCARSCLRRRDVVNSGSGVMLWLEMRTMREIRDDAAQMTGILCRKDGKTRRRCVFARRPDIRYFLPLRYAVCGFSISAI